MPMNSSFTYHLVSYALILTMPKAVSPDWDVLRPCPVYYEKFLDVIWWCPEFEETLFLSLLHLKCSDRGTLLDKQKSSARDTSCLEKYPAKPFCDRMYDCASSLRMNLFLTLVGCQAQPLLQCWKFYKHPFRVRPLNVVKTQWLTFLLIQPSFPFRKSVYKATLFAVYRNITLSAVSSLSRTYTEL